MPETPWIDRLRERLAADGVIPSAHTEAIQEIADHLDELHRAAIAEGKSAAEADAAVDAELTRLGPLALAVAERARRRLRPHPPSHSWQAGMAGDIRHALRAARLDRGFSATVIVTLAIGIGACITIFSIVNALLLGSLPYPDPDRLVLMWETDPAEPSSTYIVAEPVYRDWTRETRSFASMGIWEYQTFNVASSQQPEQVQGIRASASLFRTLGVPPAVGRTFTDQEEQPGQRVAVISDALWRTHLGGQPSAIGQTVRLNGEPYEVIGVMPPGFMFPRHGTAVWVPLAPTDQDRERASHSFWVAGRLADGVTFDEARADVEQVGRSLQQRYDHNRDEGSTITRMSEHGVGPLRTMLTVLMGAVVLVLVIGCANVANLQLGRALVRRREFVVRLALGAGRARIARQLFAESVVLAIGGGVGGLVLSAFATRSADLVLSPGFRSLPFRGEVPIVIDGRVLMFAVGVALISAVLFGFAPLLGLGRREPHALLRDGERGSTGAAGLARRLLVTAEVAMAVVVLCGAGLLVKSLQGLMEIDAGLDPRDVLTVQVSLPQPDTYGPPARQSFCAELERAAEGVPGLRRIGAISHLPLSGANASRALTIDGRSFDGRPDAVNAAYRLTCPGYFATLAIPLIAGRDFTHRDVTDGAPVAIVNRAMARRYWGSDSPIGARVKIGFAESDNPWMTIVGVVDDVKHFGLDADARREIYLPYSQRAWPVMTVVAKTVGDPNLWHTVLRGVVHRTDPDLPAARLQSMENVIAASVNWRETPMRLLTGFAVIGLLLASLGVYGVLSYFVSQRAREIGVRAALGATRAQLAALVVRQSMWPIIGGVTLGVVGSLMSGRLLQQFLYQVQPADPQVIAIISLLLVAVGLLASWLPARRASSIDPMIALRDE